MVALAALGYATVFGVFISKERLFILPFFVVSLLILTLHFAALLNLLYPVAIGLKYGGLLALLAGSVMLIRRYPLDWPSRLLDTPKVFLLAASSLGWLVVRGRLLTHWDEFSHWGFMPKYLYFANHLPDQMGGPVFFLDYPPGASLFHYLAVAGGPFREDLLYHANHVLLFAPVASLFFLFTWRRPFVTAAALPFFYFLFLSIGQGFKALMVDQHMGVFFGVIVAIYLLKGREDRFILAMLSLPIGALMILKVQMGIMLLGVVLLVIFADQIAGKWRKNRNSEAPVSFGNAAAADSSATITALCLSLIIAMPLAAHFSWKAHINRLNLPVTMPLANLTPREYFDALTGNGSKTQKIIFNKYVETISNGSFGNNAGGGRTLTEWGLFSTLLFALAALLAPSEGYRRSTVITWAMLLVGVGVHLAGMLVFYLFSCPEVIAVGVHSLDRYTNIYIFATLLTSFMALAGTGRPWVVALAGLTATAYIATAIPSWGPLLRFDLKDFTVNSDRDSFARTVIPKDSSILIASEVGCGLFAYITRYNLLPRFSPFDVYIPASISSSATLQRELERFDYLYVYWTGEKLNSAITPISDPASPYSDTFLYRIRKGAQEVRLEPVNTAPDGMDELAHGRSISLAWKSKTGTDAIHHDVRGVFPAWRPGPGVPPAAHLYDHLFPDTCLAATSGASPVFALADRKLADDLSFGIISKGGSLARAIDNEMTFLTPAVPPTGLAKLVPIPFDDAMASSSPNNAVAFAAIDGNAATLWSAPRNKGLRPFITIDLGNTRQVAGVDLLSPDFTGAPEKLAIDLSEDGRAWRNAGVFSRNSGTIRWAGPRPVVDPFSPLLSYRFEPGPARFVRMKDEEESPHDWHLLQTWIYEISKERADTRPPDFSAMATLVTRKDTPLLAGDPFFISGLAMHTTALAGSDAMRFSSCYPRSHLATYPVSSLPTIASDDRHEAVVASYFRDEGIMAETRRYNGYHVWASPRHPLENVQSLPPGSIKNIVATHNPSFAMLAGDGDMKSVWRSGEAQRKGMSMTIELAVGRKVSGISMDAGDDLMDLPRKAAIEVSTDGAAWKAIPETRRVHRQVVIEQGMPTGNDTALIYLFPARDAKFIRATLLEDRQVFNWSVREVLVYEPK